jgi:hypothetical protein
MTTKRASDNATGTVTRRVRSRGGDDESATGYEYAATKQRAAGVDGHANAMTFASRSQLNGRAEPLPKPITGVRGRKRGGVLRIVNEPADAPASSNCRGGVRPGDNEQATAPAQSNGHALNPMKPRWGLRDNAGGDSSSANGSTSAASKSNGRPISAEKPIPALNGQAAGGEWMSDDATLRAACRTLQVLQRYRVDALESRNRVDNALLAVVSRYFGYKSGLDEKERAAAVESARSLIAAVATAGKKKPKPMPDGGDAIAARCGALILANLHASEGFQVFIDKHEEEMSALANTLPVSEWCKTVRGFGVLRMAVIVGEAGDLSMYANPGKLWKRLGLAPIQKDGRTQMPSTWRSNGGLSAEEWTVAGYSPRRRSVMYVIGELIVKLNKGDYRKRYDEAKAIFQAADPERSKGHCHNHGMLCATKLLVKDLWRQWNGQN